MTAAVVATLLLTGGCGGSSSPEKAPKPKPTGATVVGEKRVGPRLLDLLVQSPALRAAASVRLLTPEGWKRGQGSWPVLYLLHGCCDSYDSWTRSTDVESWPELRHTLVVMPEGGNIGFYSNWQFGPRWETFHLTELRSILERDYGAGPKRAIAGLSMGGLGAMAYAARHPGLFRGAASFSGLLNPQADPRFMLGLFESETPDPNAIWGDPQRDRKSWASHNPTALAPRLRGTHLFVSSGNGKPGPLDPTAARDTLIEPTVQRESRAFVKRAERAGIPVKADFYGAGNHDWPYWERELHRSLPTVLAA